MYVLITGIHDVENTVLVPVDPLQMEFAYLVSWHTLSYMLLFYFDREARTICAALVYHRIDIHL